MAIIYTEHMKEDKFFEKETADKIRYHIFFRKSIYIVTFLDLLLIVIVVSSAVDNLPMVKRVLQGFILPLFVLVMLATDTAIRERLGKKFNYNLYKASVNLAMGFKSDEQNSYFLIGLRYYDKYLRRKFGLMLSGLESIFNRFILMQTQDREDILKSLAESEEDALAPIRIINNRLSNISENLLGKDPYLEKLKEIITLVVPIIAIVTSIVQWLVSH